MGQRHQAFVIARVLPHSPGSAAAPKYRCIAAFHHQWCYGRLPLHATHRFITQVKQRSNAEIIRTEIAAIQGKFGRWGEEPKLPRLPCPFTAFLLATNWSTDLENADQAYASGVSFNNAALDADMGSGQGDNNDGISVIDVTDPMAPSYCFVSFDGIEAEGEVRSRVPLSAEEYVRAYYPKYNPPSNPESKEMENEATEHRNSQAVEEDVQATIAKLKDVKLVDLWMLAEAWPKEYGNTGGEEMSADIETGPNTASGLPSLTDMTFAPAVAHAIESRETTKIETMLWMPGKASAVKATLRGLSPFPDGGMGLLAKVIEKELEMDKQLDLSGFTLSSAQLKTLISSSESIDVVNLSRMSTATIDHVRVVLTFPQVKRLVLLGCPSISSENIRDLLDTEPQLFNHLEGLIHPFLIGELNDASDSCPYGNAFSYIGVHTHHLKACSLPFFTPSRVIQALIDILQPLCDQFHSYSFLQTSLAMQAAFSSVRAPGQKWSERDTVIIPQLSLRAFKGEGWTFAANIDLYGGADNGNGYAFLRFKSPSPVASDKEEPAVEGREGTDTTASPAVKTPASTWEIHDLASFVNQVTLEGKPRPTDEAVDKLQEILTSLQTTQEMRLMTNEDVQKFLSNAIASVRHLY